MSVPAGSSRSPEEEALDRMEERAAGSGISDEDVATVRERLERLTEERDELQGRVYVLENLFPEDVRAEIGSAEAEVSRLTAELQHTREGLREIRTLCKYGHGDDLIAEKADTALLAVSSRSPGDTDCEHDYVFESDDPVTYRCDKCGAKSDDGVYPRVGSFHPHKPLSGGEAR